jgi:hypothetical protein
MEQKYQNLIIWTIIITSIVWFIILNLYSNSISSKYEGDPCKNINWTTIQIQGYNGTTLGGYSCFLKGEKLTIYFNPHYPNQFQGSSPEEYKFICDIKYKSEYCYLQNKFMRVNNTNAT